MAETLVHIEDIAEVPATIRAGIDQYQHAIDITNERFTFADTVPDYLFYCASGWKTAISGGAVTYLDEWFDDLHIHGAAYVGDSVLGEGDTDTGIVFGNDDDISIKAGNVTMLNIDENAAQKNIWFNGTGIDVDFQIGATTSLYAFQFFGSDGSIELQDDDVAHGITDYLTTTAYGRIEKSSGTTGGLKIIGATDNAVGYGLTLIGATGSTDPDNDKAVILMYGGISNGSTGLTSLAATDMLFQLKNYATAVMTVLGSGNVGIGTVAPSYKFAVGSTDGSDQVGIYHDNTDAFIKWTDGILKIMTDEAGADVATQVHFIGKGNAASYVTLYDQNAAHSMFIQCESGIGTINVQGGGATALSLQENASTCDITMFSLAANNQTKELKIYGFRNLDALRSLEIGVGVDAADTASFDGVSNYYFDGNLGIGTATPASLTEIQGGLTTVGAVLTLGTKETTVVVNDVLGRINFYAPLEADGSDAILVGASIVALAEDTFSASVNKTSLLFQTGASETATTKAVLTSAGYFGVGVTDPDTALEVYAATTQQKWSHDADSAITFGCDTNSNGTFTFDAVGSLFMWASPNVSHGATDVLPTNVPFAIGTEFTSSGNGGLFATGIYDGDGYAMRLSGIIATASPAYSAVDITGGKINGTTWKALAASEYVFSVHNYTSLIFTMAGDGDIDITGDVNLTAGKDVRTTAFTTWTPTITLSGAGTVPVYATTTAYYKKVGKLIFYWLALVGDGGDEGSGAVTIQILLPAAANAAYTSYVSIGSGYYQNDTTCDSLTAVCMSGDNSKMWLRIDSTAAAMTAAAQNNASRSITVSGCYEAAV